MRINTFSKFVIASSLAIFSGQVLAYHDLPPGCSESIYSGYMICNGVKVPAPSSYSITLDGPEPAPVSAIIFQNGEKIVDLPCSNGQPSESLSSLICEKSGSVIQVASTRRIGEKIDWIQISVPHQRGLLTCAKISDGIFDDCH